MNQRVMYLETGTEAYSSMAKVVAWEHGNQMRVQSTIGWFPYRPFTTI